MKRRKKRLILITHSTVSPRRVLLMGETPKDKGCVYVCWGGGYIKRGPLRRHVRFNRHRQATRSHSASVSHTQAPAHPTCSPGTLRHPPPQRHQPLLAAADGGLFGGRRLLSPAGAGRQQHDIAAREVRGGGGWTHPSGSVSHWKIKAPTKAPRMMLTMM